MKHPFILEIVRGTTSYTVAIDQPRGIIGRGPNADIRVPFSTISSAHVEFKSDSEGFFFRDLESTNGTVVDGKKIEPNQWYKISKEISLHIVDTQLIFCAKAAQIPQFTMIQSGTLARKLLMDVLASKEDETNEDAFLEALSGPDKGLRLSLHDRIEQAEVGSATGIFSFPPTTPSLIATIIRDGDGFSILPQETIFVDGAPTRTEFRLTDSKEIEMGQIRFIFCDPLEAYFSKLDSQRESPIVESEAIESQGANLAILDAPSQEEVGLPNIDLSDEESPSRAFDAAKKSKKKTDWLLIFIVLLVVLIAIAAVIVVLSL